uniref:Uncharacterized protein n=1 Tax=Solanum lycopersicum TaxID=4081 RepID=A0A3Q7H472_SOLLC
MGFFLLYLVEFCLYQGSTIQGLHTMLTRVIKVSLFPIYLLSRVEFRLSIVDYRSSSYIVQLPHLLYLDKLVKKKKISVASNRLPRMLDVESLLAKLCNPLTQYGHDVIIRVLVCLLMFFN